MFSTWLYHFCKYYVRKTEGFSYDFDKNGEEWLLKKLSGSGFKTVFDVGANTGKWTIASSRFFRDAQIHAFEISQSTLRKLKKNAPASVVVNEFGLSNVDQEVAYKDYGKFQPVNTTLTNSVFHDTGLKATTRITRVRTGDAYCREHGISQIDFLKIDVEGAESHVLFGFEDMLARKAIRIIQFEYGYTSADAKFLMRDFYEFFESRGYAVGVLREGGVRFTPWNYYLNDFCSGPNYIAVRNEDAEIIKLISA